MTPAATQAFGLLPEGNSLLAHGGFPGAVFKHWSFAFNCKKARTGIGRNVGLNSYVTRLGEFQRDVG